jgi:hypothetical protein
MRTPEEIKSTILARIASEATEHSDAQLHDQYDECLDECSEGDGVKICGMTYAVSQVLQAVDPTAYRCGFVDWLDSERERIVEIRGSYYDRESAESALDELESETESEIETEKEENGEEADTAELEALVLAIGAFRKTDL